MLYSCIVFSPAFIVVSFDGMRLSHWSQSARSTPSSSRSAHRPVPSAYLPLVRMMPPSEPRNMTLRVVRHEADRVLVGVHRLAGRVAGLVGPRRARVRRQQHRAAVRAIGASVGRQLAVVHQAGEHDHVGMRRPAMRSSCRRCTAPRSTGRMRSRAFRPCCSTAASRRRCRSASASAAGRLASSRRYAWLSGSASAT